MRTARPLGPTALGLAAIACSATAAAQDEPQPPTFAFAFEEIVTLGEAVPVGDTPRGKRNIIPITGGTFSGPDIKGTIVPGGWDWQLTRADGCTEIEADYMIRTDDGVDERTSRVTLPRSVRVSPVRPREPRTIMSLDRVAAKPTI